MTDSRLYLFQRLQRLRINFPDEVSLTGNIKIIPSFHNVDQAVVCELRNGVRQIGERPVQREMRVSWLERQELRCVHPCSSSTDRAQQRSHRTGSLCCWARFWLLLPQWKGWKSRGDGLLQHPWPGQGLRTCTQLVFQTQTGVHGQSAGTLAQVHQDGLMTRSLVHTW